MSYNVKKFSFTNLKILDIHSFAIDDIYIWLEK